MRPPSQFPSTGPIRAGATYQTDLMADTLRELLRMSPVAAALLAVVMIFVSHLDKRDALFASTLSELGENYRELHREAQHVIDINTQALRERP